MLPAPGVRALVKAAALGTALAAAPGAEASLVPAECGTAPAQPPYTLFCMVLLLLSAIIAALLPRGNGSNDRDGDDDLANALECVQVFRMRGKCDHRKNTTQQNVLMKHALQNHAHQRAHGHL